MNVSQDTYAEKRKGNKKRFFILLLILLIPIFFTGFFVGKSFSAPKKPIEPEVIEDVEAPLVQEEQKPKEEEQSKEETSAVEKPTGKVVYLTFDDGPSKLTDEFLNVLQEHDVKATFFMQGKNLKKEYLQESVKRAVKERHYIGAHSMTHDFKKLYKENQFVPEMRETLELIRDITGESPQLVRPPYGSAPGLKNEQIRQQLVDAEIKVWDWTIDSQDWKLKDNPNQIIENIKLGTKDEKEIVLMHEKTQTLAALPEVIKFYKEQGYQFAIYDESDHFVLNFLNDIRL
ncbi:polysaccharide deacetylase family protein [Sporosarcina newyorkensis]|uniref:Peptidoglycan/xylan/chitin deacetylase, PgdA/CDA1 family n=1 Tax=Sporosarcina newyorkensis TaxID=759851 RepID=A0A1T4YAQ0_9BACL|nr:polysaccharide deacetylase family protein [Sporosarcina newyorkensis]SKA98902.1 Peptidoglycan/xylan/chitin deacetylase, PgdA/CDA1 family [Sporosarcina newyorkensis]